MYSRRYPSNSRPPRQPQRTARQKPEIHKAGPLLRKYDTESGQVFSEIEVTLGRRTTSNWIGDFRTPSLAKKPTTVNAGRGVRSLADTAKNKVASEIRNLTAEHFLSVPWPVAETVWKEVLDRYGLPDAFTHLLSPFC